MTPADVAIAAKTLFRTASFSVRMIQPWRVSICPMEVLAHAIPPGATMLDIGCGAGLLLGLVTPRLSAGLGIDASATAIAVAEQMRAALPSDEAHRLSFRQANDSAQWPSATYSVVSLIDVLHHVPVPQQQAVIEAAAARVAPGGLLLFKDIPPRPRWRALMNRLHDLVMARQWVHHCSGDAVAAWLSAAGLRIERREVFHRWWYAHELICARRAST